MKEFFISNIWWFTALCVVLGMVIAVCVVAVFAARMSFHSRCRFMFGVTDVCSVKAFLSKDPITCSSLYYYIHECAVDNLLSCGVNTRELFDIVFSNPQAREVFSLRTLNHVANKVLDEFPIEEMSDDQLSNLLSKKVSYEVTIRARDAIIDYARRTLFGRGDLREAFRKGEESFIPRSLLIVTYQMSRADNKEAKAILLSHMPHLISDKDLSMVVSGVDPRVGFAIAHKFRPTGVPESTVDESSQEQTG